MVKLILAAIGTVALMCSAPALTLSSDDQVARDAALQWLQVVDSGNYKDAARLISEEVRGSRDWENYFRTHRASLGRMNKRQIAEVKHTLTMPGLPDVRTYVVIRFKTSFELPPSVRAGLALNYGAASKPFVIEEIVMAKMGCCWEVCGYSITAATAYVPRPRDYGAAGE